MASDAKVDNSDKTNHSNGKNNAIGNGDGGFDAMAAGTKSNGQPPSPTTTMANKRSFTQRIQHIWNNVTLEPLVVCFVMPSMLLMLGSSNLNLEKACRVNLGYTQTVCDALTRRETANYTL